MNEYPDDAIAVVGLAARLPGAADIDRFWENLAAGRESIVFPTVADLRRAGVPDRLLSDPSYVRAVAEADDLEGFDADLFGYTPRDAAILDPQIRMFVEVAHAAVECAGYDPYRIDGSVGVYGGVGANDYLHAHVRRGPEVSTGAMAVDALSLGDYLATHVAYRFGLTGPAMTVATACSSSALAVHLACQALRTGECDAALAGGSDIAVPAHHGYLFDQGGPLAPDGHCRPFDVQAAGTVFASGAGVVMLKRLDDALADGDRIWAVLRGSAVNNDGAVKAGFAAPGIQGQASVVAEAMRIAGVTAGDLSYVEAHATGTPVGDPIEVSALAKAFAAVGGTPAEPVVLSSVKGNVGHLGHASGITSLIKTALCLRHERRAGTVNFTTVNPRLSLADTPFTVTGAATPWERRPGRPRIAGVSSFGIGGTNVHLILEEGPEVVRTAEPGRAQIVVWSGRDDTAREAYRDALRGHFEADDGSFADAVAVLHDGRTPHPVRAAAVAASSPEAAKVLASGEIHVGDGAAAPRPVVFLFPGQGAQHRRMAAGLYGADEVFSGTLDTCLDLFARAGADVRGVWERGTAEELRDTAVAQPLLFAVEYALARMWQAWGIRPAVVCGHSLGELVAAAVAGVFSLADAVRIVVARAEAMAAMPPGAMLAVPAAPDELTGVLPPDVAVAVVNGLRSVVISGDADRLAEVARRLPHPGVRMLRTSHAFHHPSMAPAAERLLAAFDGVELRPPAIPMVSAATGEPIGAEATEPHFWADQLVLPVRFDRAVEHLGQTPRTLLEVGPGSTLAMLAARQPAVHERCTVLTTLDRSDDDRSDDDRADDADLRAALAAAAILWTAGHPLDFPALRGNRPARRLPLPGYPYRRTRHWLDTPQIEEAEPSAVASGVPPLSVLTWTEAPVPPSGAGHRGATALAVLTEDRELSAPVALAVRRAGYRLVIARPGGTYAEDAGEFRIRPDHVADLDRMFDALAGRDAAPSLLVHALALGEWAPATSATVDEQLTATFHSLTELVRRGSHRCPVTGVTVVTSRSVDITGAEPLDPVKATLHGAVRTLALELPDTTCRLVDVAGGVHDIAAGLAAELESGAVETVTALRGRGRWVRVERPYVDRTDAGPAVRPNGVYLLTGGLGGIGLTLARELAATGLNPVLVLAGRHGTPADGAAGGRLHEEVAELESRGATVQIVSCDVADRRAVRRLVDTVRARHGALHGVFHLAGVAGDGMLLFRSRADSEAVLRPKVAGTLALTEALAGRSLDFFVAFSSRAAVGGLVGSGDYAAGNAFLDNQTRLLARSGVRAISVNWPSWRATGMTAPAGVRRWTCVLGADDTPIVDEHRLAGVPVMPGTGNLDLILRAYAATTADEGPAGMSDVVFRRALVLGRRRRVLVEFRPAPDGWAFELSSEAVTDGSDRAVHVTGTVGPVSDAGRPAVEPLADLRKRLGTPLPVDGTAASLFVFGPRWRSVVGVTGTAEERLIEVALPVPFHDDLRSHRLHPALLDLVTAEAAEFDAGVAYVPFLYERVDVRSELPAAFTGHLRRRRAGNGVVVADVDLLAGDGTVLVRITGFTMRAVAGADDVLGSAGQPEAPIEGIAPVEGARLCLSLLGGDRPSQLLVRPHVDGEPLPPAGPRSAVPSPSSRPHGGFPLPPSPVDPVPVVGGTTVTGATVLDRLHGIWSAIIGNPALGPDDDFFEIGGDSLAAVELMRRIRETFGVRMSVVSLFDHPTVRRLAEALVDSGAG